jgi:predicted Ser/Thr protein kinase
MLPDDKTEKASNTLQLICPTCGARYTLPKYVEGQRYGCKRCSASLMFGKFALLQELGRGGFGVVYKAFQADLERVVALKFLHTDSQESTERFMREARIAANLSHPNITAIYEVGQHEGKPYITMQFVDGITTNRADFGIREAVFVMRDAAIAVDYAHARDVIHRDIKPHNIMVMQDRSSTSAQDTTRRTFVMDFGLARSANKGGTLTTEGQVMGTPAFMAPEQAEGKPCDLRSDVYSLGATLFQLVTKRPPFEAPTPLQVLMAVTQEDPPAPSSINPEIDKGLEAIILKAMAKDPAHRYPTAARFAQDLTSWLAGGVTDAGPTLHLSMTPGALKAAARKKKSGAMVALGLMLILAGAGGLAWRVLGHPPETGAKTDPPPGPEVVRKDPPPPVPDVPQPKIVLLEVRTDPSDATLTISTKQWRTPVELNDSMISPGTHEIRISKPGFKEIKEKVTITSGPQPVKIDKKLQPEDRKLAFRIESSPPGAKIMLNGTGTGEVTPHTVYLDEVGGVAARVELELEGYDRETRNFPPSGDTKRVLLTPKTGTFVVMGALPTATIHLFALPPGAKNVKALAGLWSENPDQVEQAVAAVDPADAPFVVDQLRSIAARPNPKTREKASKLAAAAPSPTPMKPEKTVTADGRGAARLENAWIMNRYCIFATSPRTLDFLAADLVPVIRNEISVPAEMVVLTTVSAKAVRPAVGQFKVVQTDQNSAQTIVPGGSAVKVAVGPVTLQYVPPPNDAILRPFTLPITVKEPYELAGNLYQYCAEAYLKDPGTPNIPMALRAYTKYLEEKLVATSELPERAKTAEAVRILYRGWVDAYEKQGRTLGGDLAARIDEARKKPSGDAVPALLELYTAKDGSPATRGAAASALAFVHARIGAPYESMEWSERSVKEKIDLGQESIGAVITASKGFPGLEERWREVSAALEEIRKPAVVKTDPVPPTPAPSNGKIGILQLVSKTIGIIVKLESDVLSQLAKGDVLEVYRDDKPVGDIIVTKMHGPEGSYPMGSVECQRGQGAIQKGDEVRRKK